MLGPTHERQTRMHCALHATNALLQRAHGPPFTAALFEAFAVAAHAAEGVAAPFFNPHRSLLRCGDWSVEVIFAALKERGLCAAYFDPRRATPAAPAAPATSEGALVGFILHKRSAHALGWLLGARHWVALVLLHGVVFDCDSLLPAPRPLGPMDAALARLRAEADAGATLFIVREEAPRGGEA